MWLWFLMGFDELLIHFGIICKPFGTVTQCSVDPTVLLAAKPLETSWNLFGNRPIADFFFMTKVGHSRQQEFYNCQTACVLHNQHNNTSIINSRTVHLSYFEFDFKNHWTPFPVYLLFALCVMRRYIFSQCILSVVWLIFWISIMPTLLGCIIYPS